MMIRKRGFLNFANKHIIFVAYQAISALEVMKRQTMLPSLLWICLVSRLVCPTLILNTILTNIFFPLGKMIGVVRSQTSFILSSRSWEIGTPSTVVQEGWTCLVSCPHRSLSSDPFIHLEEESSTSVYSDSLPHFGGVQSFC